MCLQDVFRNSLATIDKLYPLLGSEVFSRFWSQIPWPLSSFHLQKIESIRSIRKCMCDPSGAGLRLILSLNWNFDENGQIVSDPCKSRTHGARISPAIKSEIVAIILHLTIMRNASDLPEWMKATDDLNEELLYDLMLGMDWKVFQVICGESSIPGPWIIQPIVLGSVNGSSQQLAARVKRIAKLLCRVSSQISTVEVTGITLETILPLFGFSVCTGRLNLDDREGFVCGKVELPESIPVELLQGTIELEQLQIQSRDAREIQSGSDPGSKSMSVHSCFKLTLFDHVEIFDLVLDSCSKYSNSDLLKTFKSYIHVMNAPEVFPYDPWTYFSLPGPAIDPSEDRIANQDTCIIEQVLRVMAEEASTVILSNDFSFDSDALPWYIGDFEVSSRHPSQNQQRKFSPARALHFARANRETTTSASSTEMKSSDSHYKHLEALQFILSSKFEEYAINSGNLHLSSIGTSSCNVLFSKDLFDHEVIVFLFERIIRKLGSTAGMKKRGDDDALESSVAKVPVSPVAGESSSMDDREEASPNLQEEFRKFIPKSILAVSLLYFANRPCLNNHPLLITTIVQEAQKRELISEKYEWQKCVILVLQAMQCPFRTSIESKDLINLWLHSLEWLNDSRWRRLPAGKCLKL